MILKVDLPAETFQIVEKSIKGKGFYIAGLDNYDLYALVNVLEVIPKPDSAGQIVSVTLEIEEKFGSIVISRTVIDNLLDVIGIFPRPHAPGFMYVR